MRKISDKVCGKKHPAIMPFQVSFQQEACWAAPLLLRGYPSTLVRMDSIANKMQSGSKAQLRNYNQLPLSEKVTLPSKTPERREYKRKWYPRSGEKWCKVFALPAVWYLETTWFNMKKTQKLF